MAVLDPRLSRAGYRSRLLSGLPPMYRTTDLEQVLRSLQSLITTGKGQPNVGEALTESEQALARSAGAA